MAPYHTIAIAMVLPITRVPEIDQTETMFTTLLRVQRWSPTTCIYIDIYHDGTSYCFTSCVSNAVPNRMFPRAVISTDWNGAQELSDPRPPRLCSSINSVNGPRPCAKLVKIIPEKKPSYQICRCQCNMEQNAY